MLRKRGERDAEATTSRISGKHESCLRVCEQRLEFRWCRSRVGEVQTMPRYVTTETRNSGACGYARAAAECRGSFVTNEKTKVSFVSSSEKVNNYN